MRAAEMSQPALLGRWWQAAYERRQAIILSAALLLGAALRLVGLGRKSFWVDELYVIWEARQRLGVLFDPQIHVQHPPGYRLALHAWLGLGLGETWIRLLPALAGVLLIAVAWGLARALWPARPAAASATALLVATSPYLLHYSQDATSYSWTSLWVTGSVLLLVCAWRSDRPLLWAAWGVSMAVAMYSHYMSFFPLLVEGLAILVLGVPGRAGRKRLLWASGAIAFATALYLPWLLVLLTQGRNTLGSYLFPLRVDDQWLHWLPILLAGYPNGGLWQSPAGLTATWSALALACAWGTWRLLRSRDLPGAARLGLLAGWGIAATGGPYLFLQVTSPPGSTDPVRFATMATPALLTGLGGLLASLPLAGRLLLPAAWLILAGVQVGAEYAQPPVQDWRGLMSTVAADARPEDVMLAFPALHAGAAAAYYPEPAPLRGGWFVQEGADYTGAAYWFPPDWHWRGFLETRAQRSTDWPGEIAAHTSGARRIWYLEGDAIAGPYAASPAAKTALEQAGWHGDEVWHHTPLVLRLYTPVAGDRAQKAESRRH
jgi:mannosyltransferase